MYQNKKCDLKFEHPEKNVVIQKDCVFEVIDLQSYLKVQRLKDKNELEKHRGEEEYNPNIFKISFIENQAKKSLMEVVERELLRNERIDDLKYSEANWKDGKKWHYYDEEQAVKYNFSTINNKQTFRIKIGCFDFYYEKVYIKEVNSNEIILLKFERMDNESEIQHVIKSVKSNF